MNLPNRLTLFRIILVPFVVAATLIEFPFHFLVAGILFGVASITDYFDGKIAREKNLITDFGKFADPLADKILVISILICFLKLDFCMAVPVILILLREFTVTSMRLIAASKGIVVAANFWGKLKTVTQLIAIIAIYLLQTILFILSTYVTIEPSLLISLDNIFVLVGHTLIWISTVFAIISGIIYIVQNKDVISTK